MTLRNSWPGPTNVTTTTDARIDLGGLIEGTTAGAARPGVFPSTLAAIVTARSDMNINIAAFQGAAVQFGGPVLVANDGTAQLPAVLVSPVSGTNFYVVYAKQNEQTAPGTDANNLPVFAAALSTVSFAAARASLPTGGLELATVQVPSGVAATNAVGVTITQTCQYTVAEGGVLPVRNSTELTAWTPADGSLAWQIDIAAIMVRSGGAWTPLAGGWTAYTPTWGSTGTAPTLGASTLVGFYRRTGFNEVEIKIFFQIGTGANGGTGGTFTFSLPFTAASNPTAYRTPFTVHLENAGTGFYTGTGVVEAGASVIGTIAFNASAGAVWGGGSGFAIGSKASISGTYLI